MLLGAAAVWAIAAGPVDVSAWAAAFDKPELGAAVDAAGRQLTWGHLTLTLASGRLHPVRVAGETAGVYFKGAGRLRYVSTDPVESPIYRRNAETTTQYRVDAQGAIEDDVTEALVFLSSGLPEGLDSPAASVARENGGALKKHLERFENDLTPPYRQLMAQARLDPPAQPLVVAEIQAGHDDLFYVHDALRTGEETIGTVRQFKKSLAPGAVATSGKWRLLETLSRQPIGRPWLGTPPVAWTMRRLEATVVNPRGNKLEVQTRQTFEARQPIHVLALNLATSFPLDQPGDVEYELDAVQDATGRALPVARKRSDVLVQLPAGLAPGETIELTFRMSGDVLFRSLFVEYWSLLSGWYPSGYSAQNSAFTYRATVKVPKRLVAFTSGATVRRWEEKGLACAEFAQPKPIGRAMVLAGKYATHVDAREGLVVRVSSYGTAKPDATRTIAGMVHAFVAFYEPLLGRYPFPELDVVEIASLGFALAPAGMIFVTSEAFNPITDPFTEFVAKGVNARIAHEVAHGWWGHVVRPSAPADRWMSESIAEYYAALAMQLRDRDDFRRMLDGWKDTARPVRSTGSVYLAHAAAGEARPVELYALLYAKGPLVLHALRQEIGDQAFFTVFKSLLSSFPMKDATTKDVIAITNLVTKKDYGPWFERYLLGTEWPSLEKDKQD